jgi:muramoyltetrapeptide carboxypeptidase
MIKPERLQTGDTIGILSPSYALNQADIPPALDKLREKGFNVLIAKNAFKTTYQYAASPQERADDFNGLIADTNVKMLLFGGGEVCNEIMPLVDYSMIRRNPKIICSYSDSTTILNAVQSLSGVVTYYGQSLRTFCNLSPYNDLCFQNALMDDTRQFQPNSQWSVIRGGRCEGRLLGGYLANFAIMQSGRYFNHDTSKKVILFIEDHISFSSPSVVSKYFSHIEQSGLFACVSGMLFGHYSAEPQPVIDEILQRLAQRYNIPVARCEDFGHGENNAILPIGIEAALDCDRASLLFKESIVSQG